jgi:hypothetical protein
MAAFPPKNEPADNDPMQHQPLRGGLSPMGKQIAGQVLLSLVINDMGRRSALTPEFVSESVKFFDVPKSL